jgi:hypothetical protein
MQSIRRALAAVGGTLAVTAAAALVAIPAASAKTGPISIDSVWAGDSQLTPMTVLNSGGTATYNVKVENTTGAAMQVDVEFEVYDTEGPSSYDYYYTADAVNLPPGLSWFYSPSTIPLAATTDNYTARISIWPTDSANPSNDGDVAEADFHIFSLSASPLNSAIQELQNAALCAAGVLPFGGDDLLLERVQDYGTTPMGFFEDEQTQNVYWAYVNLTPVGTLLNCVSAITGAGTLFHAYQMVTP